MKAYAPPLFESALLNSIASAIERRGKGIRYHGRFACSRAVEDSSERLNVDFTGHFRVSVRISIWADGLMWLSVTQPGPNRTGGWALCEQFHIHFDSPEAGDILERFEQTIHTPAKARTFWLEPLAENRNA